MPPTKYPFVPESTRTLLPGQFWAIPLSDGSFGCGRVIALKDKDARYSLKAFLAGLLDWHEKTPSSEDTIKGRKTLEQGHAHIKTIIETGGSILGWRQLELDGIEPDYFLNQSPDSPKCKLMRGFETLRIATPSERSKLSVFSTWGYEVIRLRAEKKFCVP